MKSGRPYNLLYSTRTADRLYSSGTTSIQRCFSTLLLRVSMRSGKRVYICQRSWRKQHKLKLFLKSSVAEICYMRPGIYHCGFLVAFNLQIEVPTPRARQLRRVPLWQLQIGKTHDRTGLHNHTWFRPFSWFY